MAQKAKEKAKRPYDHSDLKELMDNAGGWAKDWDNILRYIKGPADYDADFAKDEIPALAEDIERLKREKVKYTTDYRKVWEAITGEKAEDLPEPEGVKRSAVNPIELEDKYLKGLDFPADKQQALKQAKHNKAPQRVLDVLGKIEDDKFESMGALLEAVGDETWDHD